MTTELAHLISEYEIKIEQWRDAGNPHDWDQYIWYFGITYPGWGFRRDRRDFQLSELEHLPTILSRWPAWQGHKSAYRAACLGCGWVEEGDTTSVGYPWQGAEPSVETAHDHAWPTWRELPVLQRSSREAGSLTETQIETYERAYLEKRWPSRLLTGAPMLTERSGMGTRHVPGVNPWGGYDLCGRVVEKEQVYVEQPALF